MLHGLGPTPGRLAHVRTLSNLAARFGATGTPTTEQLCVDPKRQWRQAGNIRHNSAIRSGLWMMTHPHRMFRRARG